MVHVAVCPHPTPALRSRFFATEGRVEGRRSSSLAPHPLGSLARTAASSRPSAYGERQRLERFVWYFFFSLLCERELALCVSCCTHPRSPKFGETTTARKKLVLGQHTQRPGRLSERSWSGTIDAPQPAFCTRVKISLKAPGSLSLHPRLS